MMLQRYEGSRKEERMGGGKEERTENEERQGGRKKERAGRERGGTLGGWKGDRKRMSKGII